MANLDILEGGEGSSVHGPTDKTGKKWRVTIIKGGVSKNRRFYRDGMLERDARLFEGARAFVDHATATERRERPEGSLAKLGGWYDNVAVVKEGGETRVDADFHVVSDELRRTMLNAYEMGRPDLIGLSINARATNLVPTTANGQPVESVEGFELVRSVDVVTVPGAGGAIRQLLESHGGNEMSDALTAEEIKELVASASAQAAEEAARRTADEFRAALLDAVGDDDSDEGYDGQEYAEDDDEHGEGYDEGREGDYDDEEYEDGDVDESYDDFLDALGAEFEVRDRRMAELERQLYEAQGRNFIDASLAKSTLPDAFREHARGRMVELLEAGSLTADGAKDILESTAAFAEKVAPVNPEGTPGDISRVQPGEGEWDRFRAGLGVMLGEPSTGDNRGFASIMEAYYNLPTHDRRWGGFTALDVFNALSEHGQDPRRIYDSELDGKRVQESVTTATFGELFADVMYQRMMKVYNDLPYEDWRKLVSQRESVTDFRNRRWIRWGMYPNVPRVEQGAPYQNLTTPSDEEAYYTIAKYGGLEDLTIEAITMDNLGQLRRIPEGMAYAVKRTLWESLMDAATTGALTTVTTYDAKATYHADHANLASANTVLLTPDGLNTIQQAMRKQKPYGAPATEYLGSRNKIKILIVNPAYEYRAMAITNPSPALSASITALADSQSAAVLRDLGGFASIDPFAFANKGIEVIVYDKLEAAGNNNFYVFADPNQPGIETLVVGFLNGRDTPELFVQDASTNAGAAFTADKITYKTRMFWGYTWLDHRSSYCAQVS